MADSAKQSPFGINAVADLTANIGFYIQPVAEAYMGRCQYTDNADAPIPSPTNDYQPGKLITDTILKWPTYAINDGYRRGAPGQVNPVLPGATGPTGASGATGATGSTGASGASGYVKKVRFTVTAATSGIDTVTFVGPNQFTFSTQNPGTYYQDVWIGFDYGISTTSSVDKNVQYIMINNDGRTIAIEDSGNQRGDFNDLIVTAGSGTFSYTRTGYRAPVVYRFTGGTDEGEVGLSSSLSQTVVIQDDGRYIFSVFIKSGNVDLGGATGVWPADVGKIYYLYYEDAKVNGIVYFNLETKAWVGIKGTQQDALNPLITEIGNGWYRISITTEATAGTRNFVMGICNNYQIENVDLTVTSGKRGFFWGAMLESGATTVAPGVFTTNEPRRNLLTNPLNLSAWKANALAVQAISPVNNPVGGTTAYSLTEVKTGKIEYHQITEEGIKVDSGNTYTFSVYFDRWITTSRGSTLLENGSLLLVAGALITGGIGAGALLSLGGLGVQAAAAAGTLISTAAGAVATSTTALVGAGLTTAGAAQALAQPGVDPSSTPFAGILIKDGSVNRGATVDLNTKEILSYGDVKATIQSVTGTTWQRLIVTAKITSPSVDVAIYIPRGLGYEPQYGRTFATELASCAQLELGDTATAFQDTQDFKNPTGNKNPINLFSAASIFNQNSWAKDFCYVTPNCVDSPLKGKTTTTTVFNYKANTTVSSGDPGSGNIAWNNTLSQVSSTNLFISRYTAEGDDIDARFLALLTASEKLLIKDSTNSGNYQTWTISGLPVENAGKTYWTVPISLVGSGSTDTYGNNFTNAEALTLSLIGTTVFTEEEAADMVTTGYTLTPQTYNNLITIGKNTIPALGNSPPDTWNTDDPSGVWKNSHTNWYTADQAGAPANPYYPFYNWYDSYIEDLDAKVRKNRAYKNEGQLASWWPWSSTTANFDKLVPNRSITMWGWLRAFPLQAWNEFNFNGQSQIGPLDYSNFCYSFSTADGYQSYNNTAIIPIVQSATFLKGSFSNQNDLMSADVLGVSLASREFGQDLINLGAALDLSLVQTLGLPSSLLRTLYSNNAVTSSLLAALLTIGLTQDEISNIYTGNTVANKAQEQKIYAAMLIIMGPDLAEILLTLNCRTLGLETLADLLNVKKMFPLSYSTLTVPIYNTSPGPTNSKTYYPLFVDGQMNPTLKAPPIKEIVSKFSIPAPPAAVIPDLPEITLAQHSLEVALHSQVTANTANTTVGNLIQNTNNSNSSGTGDPGGPIGPGVVYVGCPAPWTKITMFDGSSINAGDIKPGMLVYTKHESKDEWGAYKVTAKEISTDTRWIVKFEEGLEFVGTDKHRVLTDNDWTEIQNLKSGDRVLGKDGAFTVTSSSYYDEGEVVKITVEDAHTYLTEGFLSHNIKLSGNEPG